MPSYLKERHDDRFEQGRSSPPASMRDDRERVGAKDGLTGCMLIERLFGNNRFLELAGETVGRVPPVRC